VLTKEEGLAVHRLLDQIDGGVVEPHLSGDGTWKLRTARSAA